MVERRNEISPHASDVTRAQQIPKIPELAQVSRKKMPKMDKFDLSGILRPPILRFRKKTRLGGPKFEQQAITNIKFLQGDANNETIENLVGIIEKYGPEVRKRGSQSAISGLGEIETFAGMNAVLAAMKLGGDT